jgi:hypothetical protein
MTFDVNQAVWLSVLGALYDIAGAYLLSKALFIVKPKGLLMQASSGYGGFSAHILRMFCEQKVDARFGLGLLIGGFILQALSSAGVKVNFLWALVLMLPGIAVFAWYQFGSHGLVRGEVQGALQTR